VSKEELTTPVSKSSVITVTAEAEPEVKARARRMGRVQDSFMEVKGIPVGWKD